jgi:hypothetical protein
MNLESFDGIIACGDSYTIGPVNEGSLSMDQSWPAHLGNIMNLPVVNLSRGGASNTEISLQPLNTLSKFERPLLIFGFTIDYRIPYFNSMGNLHSMYGLLDSDFVYENKRGDASNKIGLAKPWMQSFLLPTENGLTGVQNMFVESINRIFAWERLIPNSKVIWGVLHSTTAEGPAIPNNILTRIPKEYMDSCFNIDNKPYENISYLDHTISDADQHPNSDGLKKYAEAIHHFINT